MQATNKSDATQVYEGAERATRVGIKDFFKYRWTQEKRNCMTIQ